MHPRARRGEAHHKLALFVHVCLSAKKKKKKKDEVEETYIIALLNFLRIWGGKKGQVEWDRTG